MNERPTTTAGLATTRDLTGTSLDLGSLANPRRTRWVEEDLTELADAS